MRQLRVIGCLYPHLNADLSVLGVDDLHDSLQIGDEVVAPDTNVTTITPTLRTLRGRNATLGRHSRRLLDDATEATMGIVRIVAQYNVVCDTVTICGKLAMKRQRREHHIHRGDKHAVSELNSTDLKRSEQLCFLHYSKTPRQRKVFLFGN